MKILKVFGAVVGIHVFALILIFANPGCSAMTKSAPAPDTAAAKPDTASPTITVPTIASGDSATGMDPNALAGSPNIRFSPTRPNTAAAGALESEPVSDVTPVTTYTVSKGDSMSSIAHRNHLTKAELAAANNLKSEAMLKLGQKIIIPGKAAALGMAATKVMPKTAGPAGTTASSMDAAAAPKGSADAVKHIVKSGETLGAIARKYQVKTGDIAAANNISDPAKIRPGTELIIPGWQAPAGKAGKSGTKPSGKTLTKAPAEAAKPMTIPTISIPGEDQAPAAAPLPAPGSPPVIQVDEAPATGKP